MQFMVVYHPGPEGLALNPPLRWQHGPTAGVKLLGGWVSIAGNTGRLEDGRTFIAIEGDTIQAVNGFVNWMRPFTRGIEVLPVTDYLPTLRAYEARDPEQRARAVGVTDADWQHQTELFKRYAAAKTPAEAVEIWRNASGLGGGKDILDALRARQELDHQH